MTILIGTMLPYGGEKVKVSYLALCYYICMNMEQTIEGIGQEKAPDIIEKIKKTLHELKMEPLEIPDKHENWLGWVANRAAILTSYVKSDEMIKNHTATYAIMIEFVDRLNKMIEGIQKSIGVAGKESVNHYDIESVQQMVQVIEIAL